MRTTAVRLVTVAVLSAAASPAAVSAQPLKIDSDTFGGLEARSIGPAAMSGRVAALDAVEGDRLTIFVGAAGGGVWKSMDGGLRFKPVFDKHNQSIGAIAIDRRNPKVVWVGTGESWVRNSVSVGDGLYKSTDGGDSWQRVGLEQSERIARVVIDPTNSDTVFACALGPAFNDHEQRGVFRTTDGGKTWEQVLKLASDTGCADMDIDPRNPKVLYAAMWQFRRLPWFFASGGRTSGLYKSTDGGSTWQPIRAGLPAGDLGRIAVAVAPSKPDTVYATVESTRSALYRSDDAGATWRELSNPATVTARPFYFSEMAVDPENAERVYKLGLFLGLSDDGGKTFATAANSVHPDLHAIWINPKDTDEILIGTDGGVYHTFDRGTTWRFVGSLPISQFYRVSADMARPYNVYGGLQDNNTWWGPSRKAGGVLNKHWAPLTGGDGFWAFADPTDEDFVYSEYQGGTLFRSRKSTGEVKDIKPTPREGEPKYRFNWNTPIHLSPTQRGTMYYGAQFLFRSRDRGESWERISPDLTTNDRQKQKQGESGGLTLDNSTAENHCTIFSIAESPLDGQVIWVGTDDGQVQVTRDGGRTWTDVTGNVTGLPKNTWVSYVEPSRFEKGTAYATFDGHMTGDMTAYLYRTRDFGATWTSLVTPALKGYAHVVREDLVNPGLLFVGTEFGLFASVDGGQQWGQFSAGLPPVAVRDLAIHPRDHDLVIATHGRGIYIVDDLTPLRKLTAEVLDTDVVFLPTRPQEQPIPSQGEGTNGDAEFVGRVPAESASIAYYLKKRHMFGDLKLEISDASGTVLATIDATKRRGLNRVEWPMRIKAPRVPPGAGIIPNLYAFVGPRVPPGTYAVRMLKAKETYSTTLDLVPDPRAQYTAEERAAQQQTVRQLYALLERLAYTVASIADASDQVRARGAALPAGDPLRKRADALAGALEAHRTSLVSSQRGEGISGEEKLREEIGMLYGNVNGHEGRPTQSQVSRMAILTKRLDEADAKLQSLLAGDGAGLSAGLVKKKLDPIVPLTREAWEAKE